MTTKLKLLAPLALLSDGWQRDVLIEIGADGRIESAAPRGEGTDADARPLNGPVVPGMPNLHSHAFQRAMAGLTERRGSDDDSFWSWRETMYRFLERLSPDDIEVIAAELFMEMLEAGFTSVAEFHYLHHDVDGRPYADPAETSHRIVAAARQAGIRLTHLPVLYMHGGFGGAPLADAQRRFAHDFDGFARLTNALYATYIDGAQIRLGVALHSLRAVDMEAIRHVLDHVAALDSAAPIHVHIAEQRREVEECLAFCGRRPVEYLFDHAGVDARWCLVHATHVDDGELRAIAKSGAVAGLCPSTEANLGDGLFPAAEYLELGGCFGIGTDSHVCVSPTEELRLLEYGQRLKHHRRAVLTGEQRPSVGRNLYETTAQGGARALGIPAGRIEAGTLADLVVLDADSPALYGRDVDALLDAAVFAPGHAVKSVWVGGREVVSAGLHPQREAIFSRYKRVVERLQRAE